MPESIAEVAKNSDADAGNHGDAARSDVGRGHDLQRAPKNVGFVLYPETVFRPPAHRHDAAGRPANTLD